MKKGFSFVELMVVLIIIGIAVSFAAPAYMRYSEKSKGRRAEASLISIYNMERRYRMDNGSYYTCAAAGCTMTGINNALGLYIRDPYFTYSIRATLAGRASDTIGTNTPGFIATATRNASASICAGNNMVISSDIGTSGDSIDVDKSGCSAW
jgi:prepilin-type N-terminal cleavage/methylation domain-containing protein